MAWCVESQGRADLRNETAFEWKINKNYVIHRLGLPQTLLAVGHLLGPFRLHPCRIASPKSRCLGPRDGVPVAANDVTDEEFDLYMDQFEYDPSRPESGGD